MALRTERRNEPIEYETLFGDAPDLSGQNSISRPLFGSLDELSANHGHIRSLKQRVLRYSGALGLTLVVFGTLYLAIMLLE